MKKIFAFAAISLVFQLSTAQTELRKFASPQELFQVLVEAIKSEDLQVYASCWNPETMEREGQVSRLKEDPGGWEELQGIFQGPQKLKKGEYSGAEGNQTYSASVKAPKAKEGGIGNVRMVQKDGGWLMNTW